MKRLFLATAALLSLIGSAHAQFSMTYQQTVRQGENNDGSPLNYPVFQYPTPFGLWMWPIGQTPPWFPNRGVPYLAVQGDVELGEWATFSTSETAFARHTTTGLTALTTNDYFSAMWGCPDAYVVAGLCHDTDGGSFISMAPVEAAAGPTASAPDGTIELGAHGWNTHPKANSILFSSRSGPSTKALRWQMSGPTGSGTEYDLVPAAANVAHLGTPSLPLANVQTNLINGQPVGGGGGGSGKALIHFVDAAPLPAGTAVYTGAWAHGGISAAYTMVVVPVAGTIRNLQVRSDTLPGSGFYTSYALFKNGASLSPTMSCHVTNTGLTCSDLTDTFTVSAGDYLQVQEYGQPGSATVTSSSISVELDPN